MSYTKRFDWTIWLEDKNKCKSSFDFYLKKEAIKIEQEKEHLSKSHLNKTDYNLDFINFLLEQKRFYDWIIAGCYYAIYHASMSLLALKGYSAKNHLATLCSLINLYYKDKNNSLTKEDIQLVSHVSLEKEEVSYFVEAKDKRETASYGISEEFNKKESEDLREKTILFVNKVKMLLEKKETGENKNSRDKKKNAEKSVKELDEE